MKDQEIIERANRLKQTISTEGWKDIKEYLENKTSGAQDELSKIMEKTPEKLTGKVALKHALTFRIYKDFFSWLEQEIEDGERGGNYVRN